MPDQERLSEQIEARKIAERAMLLPPNLEHSKLARAYLSLARQLTEVERENERLDQKIVGAVTLRNLAQDMNRKAEHREAALREALTAIEIATRTEPEPSSRAFLDEIARIARDALRTGDSPESPPKDDHARRRGVTTPDTGKSSVGGTRRMSDVIITDEIAEVEDWCDPYNAVVFGELNLAGVELALGLADDQGWSP